jgi:hypothetical protein
MGSQKCRIVGKSQPVLIMIDPMISTRTRNLLVGFCVLTVTSTDRGCDGGGLMCARR